MARQREEARRAWAGSGETGTDALWFALRDEIGATEFLGYETEQAEGTIVAMLTDGERVEHATAGDTVRILTNQTPFYAESGGQVGDVGAMFSSKGGEGRVLDTEKKLGALHVHELALAGPSRANATEEAREVAGVKTMLRMVDGVSAKDLKGLGDEAKAKLGSGVVALVAVADGRASLVVGVTDDLKTRIDVVELARRGAEALGGKGGGGRSDLAQAGGPDGTKAQDALAAIERRLADLTRAA